MVQGDSGRILRAQARDLIRHGIHESSGFFTCMVEEAFDGEAIVLAINPTERIFETHFSFWPSEAPWSERIA